MNFKKCSRCFLQFAVTTENFHKAELGRFGFSAVCKSCSHANYLRRSSPSRRNGGETKKCTQCGVVKRRSEFHFSLAAKKYLKPQCRVCREKNNFNPASQLHRTPSDRRARHLKRRREWYYKRYALHPEIFRFYGNVRRGRKMNAEGMYTEALWKQRVDFFGWMCVYCAKPLDKFTLTCDHKIALSKGGSNWPSNLVPACSLCNDKKGTMTFDGYVQKIRAPV